MFPLTSNTLALLENKLKCNICKVFATSPVTLGGCEHIFCSTCCKAYLGGSCPVCDIPGHVKDADVDRLLFNIATLCRRLRDTLEASGTSADDQPLVEVENPGDDSTISCDNTSDVTKPSPKDNLQKRRSLMRDKDEVIGSIAKTKDAENDNPKSRSDSKSMIVETGIEDNPARKHRKKPAKSSVKSIKYPEVAIQDVKPNRQKLPADQKTMTQFFEFEDNNEFETELNIENDSEIGKENNCKGKVSKVGKDPQKVSKKTTRIRNRQNIDAGTNCAKAEEKLDSDVLNNDKRVKRRKSDVDRTSLSDKKCDKSVVNDNTVLPSPTTGVGNRSQRASGNRTAVNEASVMTPDRCKRTKERIPKQPSAITPVARSKRPAQSSPVTPSALNKRNARGETPLQVAAIKNDVARVRDLLTAGANPNVRDNAGWTPLHEACNHGYLEVAELLLDHGAMMNVPGLDNDTPLHDAVSNNRLDCVRLLVSRGACLSARNMQGLTPTDLAVTDAMKEALNTPLMTEAADVVQTRPVDVMEYQAPCLLGTALSREEKVTLHKAASQLQVKLADDVTPEVTHLVTRCNEKGLCPRTVKLLQAILMGRWILSMEWLETSLQMGQLVCEEAFEVQGLSLFPDARAPQEGRMNRKKQLPGLFDGCHFYFYGNFEYATPSKEDLISIVKSGGGKLLSREPKPGHIDSLPQTVPYHADTSGELAHCCVYIVHETSTLFQPIRTKNMCSVPSSWIMDSAANFRLLTLPAVP